jgi:hypothetical protein
LNASNHQEGGNGGTSELTSKLAAVEVYTHGQHQGQ